VSHGDAEAIARSASVGMGIGLQSAGCSPCCLANQRSTGREATLGPPLGRSVRPRSARLRSEDRFYARARSLFLPSTYRPIKEDLMGPFAKNLRVEPCPYLDRPRSRSDFPTRGVNLVDVICARGLLPSFGTRAREHMPRNLQQCVTMVRSRRRSKRRPNRHHACETRGLIQRGDGSRLGLRLTFRPGHGLVDFVDRTQSQGISAHL
jgi:hypothetical protein